MIFNHHRFQIWNQNQHPFVHNMSDFGYSNQNLPNVTNMQGALDYLVAVIYPNAKPAVATPADLPLTGNTLADYRVVNDDGDGKSAGYRWEQREGEAAPSWHKIYDVDWSMDSILAAWQGQTLALYVQKTGHDDTDESGSPISGVYAGQRIFGGLTANTNLTLSANAGDGTGPQTGYVQVTDNFRPTVDGTLSLGLSDKKWLKVWAGSAALGTMTISDGSIIDTSGAISFGSANLTTSGTAKAGTMTIGSGAITDTSGEVNFGSSDIRTTGDLYADQLFLTSGQSLPSGSQIANFTFTTGNIACTSPTVNFNALNLTTTGTVNAGILNVGECQINANTLTSVGTNKALNLAATGTGVINLQSELRTQSPVFITNAALTISGANTSLTVDTLNLDGSSISSTSGDLIFSSASGTIRGAHSIKPTADNLRDLGDVSFNYRNVYVGTAIKNGSVTFSIQDLMSLKDANYRDILHSSGAQVGDSLFWNGTQWLASAPDTEIVHNSLSGLTTGDAGHTQFALLAGRSGGQDLIGGTAAGDSLSLESTSNSTKGTIQFKSLPRPFSDATYSSSWSGTDLGTSLYRWNDVYTVGEFKGFRFESVGSLPASSSQKIGRAYYNTADQNLYLDTGTTVKQVGGSRVYYDTVWDGSETTKDITVSGVDARLAIWQLKDNINDFECMYVKIQSTSATNVRITVSTPLPAGTYRLVGV